METSLRPSPDGVGKHGPPADARTSSLYFDYTPAPAPPQRGNSAHTRSSRGWSSGVPDLRGLTAVRTPFPRAGAAPPGDRRAAASDFHRRKSVGVSKSHGPACKPGSVPCASRATVISLAPRLPVGSSSLPEGRSGPDQSCPLLGLAPGGVCRAGGSPRRWCALTAPFHPYPWV